MDLSKVDIDSLTSAAKRVGRSQQLGDVAELAENSKEAQVANRATRLWLLDQPAKTGSVGRPVGGMTEESGAIRAVRVQRWPV
jgi:hypothetical protein